MMSFQYFKLTKIPLNDIQSRRVNQKYLVVIPVAFIDKRHGVQFRSFDSSPDYDQKWNEKAYDKEDVLYLFFPEGFHLFGMNNETISEKGDNEGVKTDDYPA